jgi:uncharacterized SAM-binding protein YcdF (DUF218 family)
VRVNDQLVRPILINGAFIGTFIKAGQHRIEIAYFSPWIILSFRIAFTALALILFLFLYEKTSMKKATILSLLIFVIGLPLYMGFERNYSQSVRKDLVLKNDYADRLERQLKQWKKKP